MPEDGTRPNILVVDDDEGTRDILRMLLNDAGFEIREARGGVEGLEILRDGRVDLILCDVGMPEMDGHSFREWCQVNSSTRDVPFVFLTANTSPADQVRALDGGVDDYILKPFDPQVLPARLRAALRRRRAAASAARQDSLTQLMNAKAFEIDLEKELARLKRFGGVACLALLELGEFDEIVRRSGPAMADLAMIRLADVLRVHCRNVDMIGLLDRRRFALFLPQTGETGARTLIDRVQSACRNARTGPLRIAISFRAGLAEFPRHGTEAAELMGAADAAREAAALDGGEAVVSAS